MTDQLPAPVAEFVEAVNRHDDDAFLAFFPPDGVVDDWGREFVGPDAIRGWSDNEFIGAEGTMDVRSVSERDGVVTVIADWRSTHANGLSSFAFASEGDRITRMTIRGAE
jgi:ketosteroid isomerase-like protein